MGLAGLEAAPVLVLQGACPESEQGHRTNSFVVMAMGKFSSNLPEVIPAGAGMTERSRCVPGAEYFWHAGRAPHRLLNRHFTIDKFLRINQRQTIAYLTVNVTDLLLLAVLLSAVSERTLAVTLTLPATEGRR
jgi:hypothetical protein